jgi:hypothetical protein
MLRQSALLLLDRPLSGRWTVGEARDHHSLIGRPASLLQLLHGCPISLRAADPLLF